MMGDYSYEEEALTSHEIKHEFSCIFAKYYNHGYQSVRPFVNVCHLCTLHRVYCFDN